MQYAEVLLKQKTRDREAVFTYAIPPKLLAEIGVGSYVLAPFRGKRSMEGVVVSLKRGVGGNLKGRLKEIKQILQPNFRVTTEELAFAKWLADRYYASWGEAVFAFLPAAPRAINKQISSASKTIISAPARQTDRHYLLLQQDEERWASYAQAIAKTNRQGKNCLVIFPDWLRLQRFGQYLNNELGGHKIRCYSSQGGVEERWQRWLDLRQGLMDVYLGTRLAVLTPPANAGLIIIDQPAHEGNHEEQSPRYLTTEVAAYWAKKRPLTVIEGDILPSLSQLYALKRRHLTLVKRSLPDLSANINIIDMNNEKGAVAWQLQEELAASNNKPMLLFIPRKGSGTTLHCADCDFTWRCQRCGLNLQVMTDTDSQLACHNCRQQLAMPRECPQCHGIRLKKWGWGARRVADWLNKNLALQQQIIYLDKEHIPQTLPKQAIYVATQAVFRYPIKPVVTGVVGADSLLNKPDFTASEEAFRTLFHLASITEKRVFVQTEQPQNNLYETLGQKKYFSFLQQLLQERRAYGYPPYGALLQLTWPATEEEARQDARTIEQALNQVGEKISQLGPVPVRRRSKGATIYWQILIKSPRRIEATVLDKVVPAGWKVEFS